MITMIDWLGLLNPNTKEQIMIVLLVIWKNNLFFTHQRTLSIFSQTI